MSRLFWLRFQKISLILFLCEKDGDQGADQQQIGVKEPAHDLMIGKITDRKIGKSCQGTVP